VDDIRHELHELATTGGGIAIETALGLAAVVLLILLHGFYVFAEFALVAVDRNAVEQKAEEGDRRARNALGALRSLSFQLSGAQLGITVTSLVVGFLAEPTIGRALQPAIEAVGAPEATALAISVALALALATAVEMVVAELIPKNYAIARPLETCLAIAAPLRLFNTLFRGLIVFLNAAANVTVRLLGIEPREELIGVRSLEEIELLIQASFEQGALGDEAALLARSISFGDKTAADVLVPRTSVTAVRGTDTLDRLAEIARETGFSRFPVYGRDIEDIVGLVHVKDSYRIPHERRAATTVAEVMGEALIVPESKDLRSLLIEMRRTRSQMAVVIDEYGGMAGIITFEDLLEEIVGDIEDEYDLGEQPPAVTSSPEGIHVLSGMLHPDEVEERTGFRMPEGGYETLAGFLLSLFERIPDQGDHASYDGWEFKVIDMENRRISKVLVVAPPSGSEEGP
jgi:CBS domain containing-hemolysin-like protein